MIELQENNLQLEGSNLQLEESNPQLEGRVRYTGITRIKSPLGKERYNTPEYEQPKEEVKKDLDDLGLDGMAGLEPRLIASGDPHSPEYQKIMSSLLVREFLQPVFHDRRTIAYLINIFQMEGIGNGDIRGIDVSHYIEQPKEYQLVSGGAGSKGKATGQVSQSGKYIIVIKKVEPGYKGDIPVECKEDNTQKFLGRRKAKFDRGLRDWQVHRVH